MNLIVAMILSFSVSVDEEPVRDFSAGNVELRAYLLEAAENHPALKERHAQWLTALERIPQVKSLDDPMFTFGGFVLSDVNRVKLQLAQKFPWFGTLRTRGEKAAAEADAALSRLQAERDRVFLRVKDAYFEFAYLAQQIEVTESQAEVLAYIEDIVTARYAVGMAKQDDLLKVQIEEEKLRDRYERLKQLRPALAGRLNEAIGRRTGAEIEWPQATPFPPPPPIAPLVMVWIRENNPQLWEFDHRIDASDKDIALAKKKGWPEFTLMVDYTSVSQPRQKRPDRPYPATLNAIERQRQGGVNRRRGVAQGVSDLVTGQPVNLSGFGPRPHDVIDLYSIATAYEPMTYSDGGEDNLLVTLNVNVPIWRKKVRAGVREARFRQDSEEHGKERTALALERDARLSLFEYENATRSHDLYEKSLVPMAEQTYESLQAAYESGGIDVNFIDLLDSIQALLQLELDVVRLERDVQQSAARLEFLMGGPWGDKQSEVEVVQE